MNVTKEAKHHYLLGNTRLSREDYAGAIDEYTAALRIDARYAEAYNGRGVARHGQGDLDGAIADYDSALAINPRNAEALYNRAMARRDSGDAAGTLADCNEALKVRPELAEAYCTRADLRRAKGDMVGAISDCDQALRIKPGLALAFNNRGAARYDLCDYAGALADYNEAIRLNPRYAEALSNRSSARLGLGDAPGAEADVNEALALRPCADFLATSGAVRQYMKDFSGAIVDFDRAIAVNPKLFWAHLLRGNARYHLSELDAASNDFRRAFELDPHLAASHIVRRLVREVESAPEAELAACDEHLRKTPNDLLTYLRKGLTLLLMGRDAESQENLGRFSTQSPQDVGYLHIVIDLVKQRRRKKYPAREQTPSAFEVQFPYLELETVNSSAQIRPLNSIASSRTAIAATREVDNKAAIAAVFANHGDQPFGRTGYDLWRV